MQKIGIVKKEHLLMLIIVIVSEMMYLKDVALSSYSTYLGDNIIYLFNGMEIFRLENNGFKIPIMFLLNQAILFYVIIKLSSLETEQMGIQGLLRIGDRKKWWFLKNIYIIKIIMIYFLEKVGLAILMSIINKSLKLGFNKRFLEECCNIYINTENQLLCLLTAILIPLFTTIVLGMGLLLFSFMIKSYYCYIIMMIFFVFSIFYYNKWFIGEYLFWGRSILADTAGYGLSCPLIINTIGIIGILKAGVVYIQRYDYYLSR